MKINITVIFIVGVVYDFTEDMKNGLGKINIINVNDETNQAKKKICYLNFSFNLFGFIFLEDF